jgi:hypothetical protein
MDKPKDTKDKKFRPGRRVSEFSPVPVMLAQKVAKRYNILIGEDFPQQRLAEQIIGVPCVFSESLGDADMMVDDSPKLFRLLSSKTATLSPQVKDNTAFWSLDPIEKGSAGANAIVRYAATLLDLDKPDKDLVERLADQLASAGLIEDIRVALWTAVWLLTGPVPQESKRWPQPWEDKQLWFSIPGVSPERRLHSLYNDLTAYALVQGDEDITLKKAGLRVSPSKVKFFKKLKLDYGRVHDTIELLDLWRTKRTDPFVCAFRISNLWGTSGRK